MFNLEKLMTHSINSTVAFFKVAALSVLLLCSQSLIAADTGIKKLRSFHKTVKSFKATFTQTVTDENKQLVQKGKGKVVLLRPGKFRWDYSKPDKQLVISNGKKIWIYDEDLEQVTIKTLSGTIGQTPARVLSGIGSLDKNFTLIDQGKAKGVHWVKLVPKKKDTQFKAIRLGFAKTLKVMELTDNIGQLTKITFSDLVINPTVTASLFTFKIPKGVDVVGGPLAR